MKCSKDSRWLYVGTASGH
jgi:hypothetical protein